MSGCKSSSQNTISPLIVFYGAALRMLRPSGNQSKIHLVASLPVCNFSHSSSLSYHLSIRCPFDFFDLLPLSLKQHNDRRGLSTSGSGGPRQAGHGRRHGRHEAHEETSRVECALFLPEKCIHGQSANSQQRLYSAVTLVGYAAIVGLTWPFALV